VEYFSTLIQEGGYPYKVFAPEGRRDLSDSTWRAPLVRKFLSSRLVCTRHGLVASRSEGANDNMMTLLPAATNLLVLYIGIGRLRILLYAHLPAVARPYTSSAKCTVTVCCSNCSRRKQIQHHTGNY